MTKLIFPYNLENGQVAYAPKLMANLEAIQSWLNQAASHIEIDLAGLAGTDLASSLAELVQALSNRYTKSETDSLLNAATQSLVRSIAYDASTQCFTITEQDGSSYCIDAFAGLVPATMSIEVDGDQVYLVVSNQDGSTTRTDISNLFRMYAFGNTDSIALSSSTNPDGSSQVTATVRAGAITLSMLAPEVTGQLAAYLESAAGLVQQATTKVAQISEMQVSATQLPHGSAPSVQNSLVDSRYQLSFGLPAGLPGTRILQATVNASASEGGYQISQQALLEPDAAAGDCCLCPDGWLLRLNQQSGNIWQASRILQLAGAPGPAGPNEVSANTDSSLGEGLLKSTAGKLATATPNADYQMPLTVGAGLLLENNVLSLDIPIPVYSVRFSGSDPSGSREDDAQGMVAQVAVGSGYARNDFDNVAFFNRPICCCTWDAEGCKWLVNAYRDEAGFAWDGSNGELLYECTPFCYKMTPDFSYISLCGTAKAGYQLAPMFANGSSKVYLPVFDSVLVDGVASSRAGDFPMEGSLEEHMAAVRAFDPAAHNETMAIHFSEYLLQLVEFATRDLESVMQGVGVGSFVTTSKPLVAESNTNRVQTTAENAALFTVGGGICVGTNLASMSVSVTPRTVTSISKVGSNTAIYFDGDPITTTTSNIFRTYSYPNVIPDVLASSGSFIANDGRHSCIWRGKVNPWGNGYALLCDSLVGCYLELTLGEGENGQIFLNQTNTANVVYRFLSTVGSGSQPTATISSYRITLSLAGDGTTPDPVANTAAAIAEALNQLSELEASYSGDGSGIYTETHSTWQYFIPRFQLHYLPNLAGFDNTLNSNYIAADFNLANSSGYIQSLRCDSRWPFMFGPVEVGGSSTSYFADYLDLPTASIVKPRALAIGSGINGAGQLGPAAVYLNSNLSYRTYHGRLCLLG